MKELLYILAVLLVFAWLIGFAVLGAGNFIHIALPLAVVMLLLTAVKRKGELE